MQKDARRALLGRVDDVQGAYCAADVAVAFRNLKELPPDDLVQHLPDTEPPEAPPAATRALSAQHKVLHAGARLPTAPRRTMPPRARPNQCVGGAGPERRDGELAELLVDAEARDHSSPSVAFLYTEHYWRGSP